MVNALKDFDTDQLLQSAASGDDEAAAELLQRHRQRLRSLVRIRLDSRLAGRVDPSDVVQDVLLTAHQRLEAYLRDRPISFYPWLRQITLNRLTDLYRQHFQAGKRTVDREETLPPDINDESTALLAERLIHSHSTPSQNLMRDELKQRVVEALQRISTDQREISVMRHLEDLSLKEIAAVLDMPIGSVMSRHFRGLKALRKLLDA
jgi:RNA polymerase sigma-70 factor (ECF subfamily)